MQYVGFQLPADFANQLKIVDSADAWAPALDADEQIRPDALVADATGLLDLSSWPAGMRVFVRKEKPHPGAQLRITDVNGWRVTAFTTNTPAAGGPTAPARSWSCGTGVGPRCEDRIRIAKDTGLTNLPLHDFDQNRIWLAIVALACELTAWWQILGLANHPAQRWEPNLLRPTAVLHRRKPRRPRPHPPTAPRRLSTLGVAAAGQHRPAPHAPSTDLTPGPPTPTTPAPPTGPWVDQATPARQRVKCRTPDTESALRRRLHRRLGQHQQTHERSRLVKPSGLSVK